MIKAIGDRVRQARSARNMTQAQLAKALHVSAPFVSNIEQGKQTMSVITLREICRVLEVSADWILANATPETMQWADERISRKVEACSLAEKNAMIKVLDSLTELLHSDK